MTQNSTSFARTGHAILRRSCMIAACGFAAIGGSADARDGLTVDTSLGVGVSTSPYLERGSPRASGSATLNIHPEFSSQQALTRYRLIGDVSLTGYARIYPTQDTYSFSGIVERSLSQSATVTAELGYTNSVVGSYSNISVPVGPVVLPSNLPVFIDDVSLNSIGQRQQSYQALVGYSDRLSPFDQISVQMSGTAIRYGRNSGADEYDYLSPTLSYTRSISDSFNVSANLNVGVVNYLGQRLGDGVTVTPAISVSRTLSSGYVLTASAGATVSKLKDPSGSRTTTNFSGTLGACRRETRWNLCVNASRQTVPSSQDGIRTQTSVGASFGMRVTESDNLSLSGSYSRSSAPLLESLSPPDPRRNDRVEFLTASANYDRRIANNLFAFVAGGISKTYEQNFTRRANVELRVGARYRFGRPQ